MFLSIQAAAQSMEELLLKHQLSIRIAQVEDLSPEHQGVLLPDRLQSDVQHAVSGRNDLTTQSKHDEESTVGITCGLTVVDFISVTAEKKNI